MEEAAQSQNQSSNPLPNNPTPTNGSPEPSSAQADDYRRKLAEELSKLDKIYDGEFTGSLPTEVGSAKAIFLKEPPLATPDFLKESNEGQLKAIEGAGMVGFVTNQGIILIKGGAASKLYQFLHADDKTRFGSAFETSIGTIDYSYSKPALETLKDLVGENRPENVADVNLWNAATKTTAEIAEMKKFVLREEKIEEVIKAAYETTSHLAEKAG